MSSQEASQGTDKLVFSSALQISRTLQAGSQGRPKSNRTVRSPEQRASLSRQRAGNEQPNSKIARTPTPRLKP